MTRRDRRALLIGAALLALAVSVRVAMMAVEHARRLSADVELARERLGLARDRLAGAAALEDSAGVAHDRLEALAARLLPGTAAAQATDQLAARLGAVASRSDTRLERVESVPDSTRVGRLVRVMVHATVEGDARTLFAFIRDLESEETVLTLDELHLVAVNPESAVGEPEVVRGELSIAGWFAP